MRHGFVYLANALSSNEWQLIPSDWNSAFALFSSAGRMWSRLVRGKLKSGTAYYVGSFPDRGSGMKIKTSYFAERQKFGTLTRCRNVKGEDPYLHQRSRSMWRIHDFSTLLSIILTFPKEPFHAEQSFLRAQGQLGFMKYIKAFSSVLSLTIERNLVNYLKNFPLYWTTIFQSPR